MTVRLDYSQLFRPLPPWRAGDSLTNNLYSISTTCAADSRVILPRPLKRQDRVPQSSPMNPITNPGRSSFFYRVVTYSMRATAGPSQVMLVGYLIADFDMALQVWDRFASPYQPIGIIGTLVQMPPLVASGRRWDLSGALSCILCLGDFLFSFRAGRVLPQRTLSTLVTGPFTISYLSEWLS